MSESVVRLWRILVAVKTWPLNGIKIFNTFRRNRATWSAVVHDIAPSSVKAVTVVHWLITGVVLWFTPSAIERKMISCPQTIPAVLLFKLYIIRTCTHDEIRFFFKKNLHFKKSSLKKDENDGVGDQPRGLNRTAAVQNCIWKSSHFTQAQFKIPLWYFWENLVKCKTCVCW